MKDKPIYVEIDIRTTMDTIWQYTQSPELHEQWDLRFSQIEYLPRGSESEPQHFRYRTRIGFGLTISGTGVATAACCSASGERISALTFHSPQAASLIRSGSGYWKYTEQGDRINFRTRFQYQTRFGPFGRWADRLLFRPLFGFATAWSFDLLRLWLEDSIPPAASLQRVAIHYLSVFMLVWLWLYQGLIPKLLYPQAGELDIMRQTGLFPGWEAQMLTLLGIAEIGLALLMLGWHRKSWMYDMQIIGLILLTATASASASASAPSLLQAPFNPLTLSGAMIGFCLLAKWSSKGLPQAKRCKRKADDREH